MANISNLDLERALLSAVITSIDPEDAQQIFREVSPDDFVMPEHKRVFLSCRDNYEAGMSFDLVTMAMKYNEPGWLSLINNITDTVLYPNTTGLIHRIKILTIRRTVGSKIKEYLNEIINSNDIDMLEYGDKLSVLGGSIKELLGSMKEKPWVTINELATNAYDDYRKKSTIGSKYISTGLVDLDTYLNGGFAPGRFVVVSARPSHGKTSIAVSMMRNQCLAGHKAGFFSLEMPTDEIRDKLIGLNAGISPIRLKYCNMLSTNDWINLSSATHQASIWNLLITKRGKMGIQDIRRISYQMKDAGVEIIYIDQLSWIKGEGKTDLERFSGNVHALAELTAELNIPIILLSQTNRDAEKTTDKAPMMSNLKQTGSLEEDADVVIMLNRPFLYKDNPENIDLLETFVVKNRFGRTGKIEMRFESSTQEVSGR